MFTSSQDFLYRQLLTKPAEFLLTGDVLRHRTSMHEAVRWLMRRAHTRRRRCKNTNQPRQPLDSDRHGERMHARGYYRAVYYLRPQAPSLSVAHVLAVRGLERCLSLELFLGNPCLLHWMRALFSPEVFQSVHAPSHLLPNLDFHLKGQPCHKYAFTRLSKLISRCAAILQYL